jgi:hypothetical protein
MARIEWLKQADVGFGLPGLSEVDFGPSGMAWNIGSWFWHD